MIPLPTDPAVVALHFHFGDTTEHHYAYALKVVPDDPETPGPPATPPRHPDGVGLAWSDISRLVSRS